MFKFEFTYYYIFSCNKIYGNIANCLCMHINTHIYLNNLKFIVILKIIKKFDFLS